MRKLTVGVLGMVLALAMAPGAGAQSTPSGIFVSNCAYSHRAADDPIVFPGKTGESHSHDFLGNTSTDADTTLASLKASPSLCRRPADRSAYWIPTLYENGHRLPPVGTSIYYRTSGRDPQTIEPFPTGLRVIAGDAKAPGPQDTSVVKWSCHEDTSFAAADPVPRFLARQAARRRELQRLSRATRLHKRKLRRARRASRKGVARRQRATLRRLRDRRLALREDPVGPGGLETCPENTTIRLSLRFPDCWDGVRLDSPDHKSHLTYSARLRGAQFRSCPASHPRPMPELTFSLRYPTRGGPGVMLASGATHTAHGDFFNAWDEAGQADLVSRCLNASIDCGSN